MPFNSLYWILNLTFYAGFFIGFVIYKYKGSISFNHGDHDS